MLDKILIPGGRLELSEIRTNYNPHPNVYISQIYDVEEDDMKVSVAMPVKEGRLIPLPVGAHFDAYFYTKNGLYHSNAVIIDRYKNNNLYVLSIELQTALKKFQRRQYFRYETSIPVRYAVMDEDAINLVEELKVIPDDFMAGKLIVGQTLDISGGGIRFAGIALEKNEKIYMEFDYISTNAKRTVRTIANVINSEHPHNRTDICHNRVSYEVISSEARESLIKYIFEEERKMRRNERR